MLNFHENLQLWQIAQPQLFLILIFLSHTSNIHVRISLSFSPPPPSLSLTHSHSCTASYIDMPLWSRAKQGIETPYWMQPDTMAHSSNWGFNPRDTATAASRARELDMTMPRCVWHVSFKNVAVCSVESDTLLTSLIPHLHTLSLPVFYSFFLCVSLSVFLFVALSLCFFFSLSRSLSLSLALARSLSLSLDRFFSQPPTHTHIHTVRAQLTQTFIQGCCVLSIIR